MHLSIYPQLAREVRGVLNVRGVEELSKVLNLPMKIILFSFTKVNFQEVNRSWRPVIVELEVKIRRLILVFVDIFHNIPPFSSHRGGKEVKKDELGELNCLEKHP